MSVSVGYRARHSAIKAMACATMFVLFALSGCARCHKDETVGQQQPQDHLKSWKPADAPIGVPDDLPEEIWLALSIARDVDAGRATDEEILARHDLNSQEFSALMYRIAANPFLCGIYESLRMQDQGNGQQLQQQSTQQE